MRFFQGAHLSPSRRRERKRAFNRMAALLAAILAAQGVATWIGAVLNLPPNPVAWVVHSVVLIAIIMPSVHILFVRTLRHGRHETAQLSRVRTMGTMATGLVHDLTQPLGSIDLTLDTFAERLRSVAADSDEVLAILEDLRQQVRRAVEIIRRFRNFVRGQASERAYVNINDVVRDAASFFKAEADQGDVTFRFELFEPLPAVLADPIQILQVIVNLLRNAVDAVLESKEGQRVVSVRTRTSESDRVEVSVTDTGPGLDPDFIDRIFEPFLTTKPGGTGMGLAISRSIIESHGGHISATVEPETGTTFRFTLPY